MASLPTTKRNLAFRSGNRCAMPGCPNNLTINSENSDEITNIGEAAHIKGEHPGAARYDPDMTDEERNHFNNLVYLCGTCHKTIDTLPQGEIDYPVAKLLEIKHNHEKAVSEAISDGLATVDFNQLEKVTKWLISTTPTFNTTDFSRIDLENKIKINKLTASSQLIIKQGLCSTSEVNHFIQETAKIEPDFPNKLTARFKKEYYNFVYDDIKGDELFDSMCYFTQQGFKTQAERSASLAVLIYLFELCEIFEKE